MYEYLDRPPQVGDIVEHQGKSRVDIFGYDKKLCIVTNLSKDDAICTNIKPDEWFFNDYFKVVKTKQYTEMKKGDHFIRIKKGVYPIGTVHTAYYSYGDRSYDCLHYTERSSIDQSEAVVLCKAKPKKEPMKITNNNPFKVDDRIKSISYDNPTDRPYGKEYTVKQIYGTKVYYKDGHAAHYSKFELVQSAPSVQETVEQINQTTKEQQMTFTQLINKIFGQELTDYEKRPDYMVIAFNRDGSEKAITSAKSIEQVTQAVQSNPELWGCKLVTYKMSKEVFTDVPVTVTKSVR